MEEEGHKIPKSYLISCYDNFKPTTQNLIDFHHSAVVRQKALQNIADRFDQETEDKNKAMNRKMKFFDLVFHRDVTAKLPVSKLATKNTKDKFQSEGRSLTQLFKDLDNSSHWICKLSSIETQMVSWFVKNETTLFISKLFMHISHQQSIEISFLIKIIQIYYQEKGYYLKFVDKQDEEVNIYDDGLSKLIIPFEDGVHLMISHKAVMKRGFIYLNADKRSLLGLIKALFSRNLWDEMKVLESNYQEMKIHDERVENVVKNLPEMIVGSFKDNIKVEGSLKEKGRITPALINQLAKKHFPLCMSEMHHYLTTKNHLKHFGRLQYGLFLKALGISVKDTKDFFMTYFKRKASNSSKLNEFKYYIDHMYGLKGVKKDYDAWACKTLMNKYAPSDGEVFGCPYVYYNKTSLKQALRRQIPNERSVENIASQVNFKNGRNLEAKEGCRAHFQELNPDTTVEKIGIHPNLFFRYSYDYQQDSGKKKFKKKSGNGKMKIEYEQKKKQDNLPKNDG